MRKVLFIFGELHDTDIEWLVTYGTITRLRAGDVLIREGQPAANIFLLLQGTVAVGVKGLGNGNVAMLERGEIVGEMSFVDTRPPSATASAATDALVLAIPCATIAAKLRGDAPFAARFYRALALILSDRLRATVGELARRTSGKGVHDESFDEIDPGVLEQSQIAGVRLEGLLQRLVPR